MRQIFLDTETTGLRVEEGHRLIEVGCLEMIDRKLTGRQFHYYFNPERDVEAGAFAVHGISTDFLRDKPFFRDMAQSFVEFIQSSEIVIHNAPFDLGFLNNELQMIGGFQSINKYCNVVDTLQMARKLHVGQRNSLDALCKRYGVDNSNRDLHGALVDAHLLAQVYLAMTGGQGSFFDALSFSSPSAKSTQTEANTPVSLEKHALTVLKASQDELDAHQKYLELLKKQGRCVWND